VESWGDSDNDEHELRWKAMDMAVDAEIIRAQAPMQQEEFRTLERAKRERVERPLGVVAVLSPGTRGGTACCEGVTKGKKRKKGKKERLREKAVRAQATACEAAGEEGKVCSTVVQHPTSSRSKSMGGVPNSENYSSEAPVTVYGYSPMNGDVFNRTV
jgi:hypothetical protein